MNLRIEISNEHAFPLDEARLKKGVRTVLKDAGIEDGEISIAIVDDAAPGGIRRPGSGEQAKDARSGALLPGAVWPDAKV